MVSCVTDLVAIPDFAAGAMENWGLITYRLTALLYDENKSSDSNKQWVAVVVAHELAHQVCLILLHDLYKEKSVTFWEITICLTTFLPLVLAFSIFCSLHVCNAVICCGSDLF